MTRAATPDWRGWVPDLLVGLTVLGLALVEVGRFTYYEAPQGPVLVAFGLAASVGLARVVPSAALGIAWLVGLSHLATGTNPLVTEVLFAMVAFGCARWGGAVTLWLSALSIPVSATVLVLWVSPYIFYEALQVAGVDGLADSAARSAGDDWRLTAALMGMALLAAPWLGGLAFRYADRARRSRVSQVSAEAARDQAEEIARLRDEQARLAHDVHDVVGHSLAVILAQAESAQYLPDADGAKLKQTMENIATSARTSLDDVRQVLASASGRGAPGRTSTDLDSLIEGVRASGHQVVSTEYGTPQPLPPELEVVAFRVLQEMLTNALKHGSRDQPVRVERHWEGELRIEVQNVVEPVPEETRPVAVAGTQPVAGGQGVDGMRRRLESVGGRLDVRRRHDPPTFTATAWLPVRTVAR
ncbi:sensor histidine kinase [Nocardioides ferulae]|uniref:sensor histidine kinase n=1 Tax=Nocardioides ferulae TaxID=2340821 RepID=UPI000F8950C0|nr:histidine kinase [Nocardioides ferulae]